MSTHRTDLRANLTELVGNHRWTWDRPTAELLAALPGASPDTHPAATVADLGDDGWAAIEGDPDLRRAIDDRYGELRRVIDAKPPRPTIAYVSAEFGISELLPQYSGGLGILAGDHLKAASDLGLALVGVGLFYHGGFFRQDLDGSTQTERYEHYDPTRLGYVDTGHAITVDIAGDPIHARVWRLAVGAVDLYALDTNVPTNAPAARAITDRLYSGDSEHRIQQELVLGIGGLRALRAMGIEPEVVHLNEGHAGFLLLEQLATALADGASLDEAIETTRAHTVFTTHTPVPAGIDRFKRKPVADHLRPWSKTTGVPLKTLFDLATSPDDPGTPKPFNMAALCLNLSGSANGVSQLHGRVSRRLFARVPGGEAIDSVTNGVHARTWVDPDLADVFDAHLGPGWDQGDETAWKRVDEIDNDRIAATRRDGRRRLIDLADRRGGAATSLDPDALTVGFARRFATYKRADLLLALPDRLTDLLADDDRPIQFVFAGKAHPADDDGKAVLERVVDFAHSPAANGRFVFVPDYDMAVARALFAGCDVWLNNPIRPREASGTSGEKSALNGGLQCSILDGWWDEMYDGRNGWAIPTSDETRPAARDLEEAATIHDLLAAEIAPLFYEAGTALSPAWIQKVRHSWSTLGPQVTAARMVADYRDRIYEPALQRARSARPTDPENREHRP